VSSRASGASRPACSVVVCTRERPQLLERCLASLVALDHPSYEILVVDNSPGDPGTERVAARVGARCIRESRTGLSRARNEGARAATGEIVAYTDDDAVVEPDWLGRHAAAFDDPLVMASTGPVLPLALDSPAARTYAAAAVEDLGESPLRVTRDTPWWFEIANFGGLGLGGNVAVRRALFEDGWRFRVSLGLGTAVPGYEESYAFFTIIRAGHAIAYRPDVVVRHPYPATSRQLRRRRARLLRAASAYVVMLLVEEPEFRGPTLRYVVKGFRGARHPWRRNRPELRFATRTQVLTAACWGPLLYARSRLGRNLEPKSATARE
jgi:glycosyltransferase involved in cell wall biosynthesis